MRLSEARNTEARSRSAVACSPRAEESGRKEHASIVQVHAATSDSCHWMVRVALVRAHVASVEHLRSADRKAEFSGCFFLGGVWCLEGK